ncbi:DUF3320 domain-containing protein [Gulosibacter sediminis]|uniref:DUF3320 domain-containing protein n=1 Tax=Gulosibacter sediminis TaxID=1729695 RepID=UPI0024ADF194|nr:DUF3320 domain-containing protein [Gulosibacter sediminis]
MIGLDRRSRLIKFNPPKRSSLTFDAPELDVLQGLVASGNPLVLQGDRVEVGEDGEEYLVKPPRGRNMVHVPRPENDIGTIARTLMRKANQEFIDRGLSVLYIAFGMLRWKDVDGSDMASPLYLVPVELLPEGPRATPKLVGSEDDPVLNSALPLRLAEFGVAWPVLDDIEDLQISEILELFRKRLSAAPDLKDWEIRAEAHLATFSFTKEAMYKDLLDNEEAISDHPIVRALANGDPTSQTEEFQFEPIDPATIDDAAPPESTPFVLDADSSQRAAVAAALAGRSFVMDGPPGTGKSQTIANMIGALMHSGKSVLFVSEKIAALDVVRNRLTDAGLGSYLLELHSHKVNRREVAVELLQTLENVTKPPRGISAKSRAALVDKRMKLNAYASAMNEIRSPLGLSLHDVLGLLAGLVDVPAAPIPERSPLGLDQDGLSGIYAALRRLERNWRPAAQGKSFLWREVVDETSLEARLWAADRALRELRGMMQVNSELVRSFGIDRPDQAHRLIELLNLQHSERPDSADERWLAAADLTPIEESRSQLGVLVEDYRGKAAIVEALGGVPFTSFSPGVSSDVVQPNVAGGIDLGPQNAEQLRVAGAYLAHHAAGLTSAMASLHGLARAAGLPEPISYSDADRVVRMVDLRASGAVLEPTWLTPAGLQAARNAAAEVRMKAIELDKAEERAQSLYRAEALSAPLRELQDRFSNLHTGLRKLSRTYRTDKKTVATLLADASQVKSGISRLSEAIAWSDASESFEGAGVVHSQSLGRYWQGRGTNWAVLDQLFVVAEEVIVLSGGAVQPQTVQYFTAALAEPAHQQMAAEAAAALGDWRSSLAPAPALVGRQELLMEPIQTSLDWIEAHAGPVADALSVVEAVNAVTGRDHTVDDSATIQRSCDEARAAAAALDTRGSEFEERFGALFQGSATQLDHIDSAISWAKRVRSEALTGGALTPEQQTALASSTPVSALPAALAKWEVDRDAVIGAFAPSRTAELLDECAEFDGAASLIEELGSDTVGQQEWFDYTEIREYLRTHDLDSTIEFCIEMRVPASEVPQVVERALLRAWADAQIKNDERLHPVLATDRRALVDEFKALDLEVIAAATRDIIRAANTRRPGNTSLGEPALLRREGMKQRRHMSVKSLISQARSAVQAIKPVFMMSPLAVSQYLPSDMKFDVVIFDEASQVTPGDSINCIYRGRAFILAGDDKQLPPTSFFARATETDEDAELDSDVQDFQSILELAKSAGAFRNLGLRWHYRSRHEALIAFSNYRFYEGKLVTYPSAQEDGPDVGVEFFLADGLYRRGGGRDNPREAKVVAERVIHHYRTRPGASLGVVTFSVAQAAAVTAAVDELRDSNRDLDEHFDRSDRLDGFFVRSLESVQGDERDVILFSVGYGPDEAGKISTNFGVLNKEKGWRRLNVGITRARQRIEVVSSMEAHDIPASQNENVEALRAYLDFAKRGIEVLGTQSAATGLMPESPFEESVIRTIEAWGYNVEPQVGAAGFRIDLAVRHPAKPGVFAIGVECDGYQYHSSPTARDRDRLRDQVLEGLGWTLHRIWGTSWYRDRATEEQRLRTAIEEAIAGKTSAMRRSHPKLVRPDVETVPAPTEASYGWVVPYKKSATQYLPSWVDPGERGSYHYLIEPISSLARAEGPVHMDLVFERIRQWWNIGRISQRMKENIDLAIEIADVVRNDDFIDVSGRPVTKVRSNENGRKPQQVHIDEFSKAVEQLVLDVGGAPRPEVAVQIARLYGWNRNGSILDARLNEAIDRAIASGRVVDQGGKLSPVP